MFSTASGHVLTPGLLDIHNHGGAGASYGEGGDAIRTAMRLHRQHGTTRQLLSSGHRFPRRSDLPNSRRGGRDPARPHDPRDPPRGPISGPPVLRGARSSPASRPRSRPGRAAPRARPTALCARSRWRRSGLTSPSRRGSCGRRVSSSRPVTRRRRSSRPGRRSTRGRPCSLTPSMRCLACIIVRPGRCSHSLTTPVFGWR